MFYKNKEFLKNDCCSCSSLVLQYDLESRIFYFIAINDQIITLGIYYLILVFK